jgi:hypothetical protein
MLGGPATPRERLRPPVQLTEPVPNVELGNPVARFHLPILADRDSRPGSELPAHRRAHVLSRTYPVTADAEDLAPAAVMSSRCFVNLGLGSRRPPARPHHGTGDYLDPQRVSELIDEVAHMGAVPATVRG